MKTIAPEDTVSMTMHIPRAVHTELKVKAAKLEIGLYEYILQLFIYSAKDDE